MRNPTPWFRLVATTAAGAMLAGPILPNIAVAQGAPPAAQFNAPQYNTPGATPAQPVPPQAGDPPAVAGRIADLSGTVSFHTGDQTEWSPASLNYPVTSGGSFWTEPGARAELEVGASRLVLDQSTELGIDTLNDSTVALTLSQGGLFLWVRDIAPGTTTTVRTPRGQITISGPGHYVVLAGDTDHPTQVTVIDGAALLGGTGAAAQLAPGQTVSITGDNPYQTSVGAQQLPPFATAELAREHPPVLTGANAPPPVVEQMTGGDALVSVGSWQETPDYGRVWYPPVQNDWVPYRDGHWAWVAPWGWTWVDDASWGFAPFHYGRWVQIGPRWGWIPVQPGIAYAERPVYAPALVTFIGLGVGIAAGAAFGASVGWIPLGPREFYRPPYGASDRYMRRVNAYNVVNVNTYNYRSTTNVFVNRHAATVVPREAMQDSRRIGPRAQTVPPQVLAAARPLAGRPVAPSRLTAGVTPGVARQLNLPPARPGAAPQHAAAPGPAIRAGRPAVPNLVRPGEPGAAVPGNRPGAPGPAFVPPRGARPGLPALARPNAGPPGAARPGITPGAQPNLARPQAPVHGPAQAPHQAVAPNRPAPQPQFHPAPQARPAPQQPFHPAPQARPTPRPAPQPQFHPAPQARPAPRPAPQPQVHPAPQARPAPRPAPQPQFHPTPQARPAAVPHPAPAPHPAPRPAPQRQEPHRP